MNSPPARPASSPSLRLSLSVSTNVGLVLTVLPSASLNPRTSAKSLSPSLSVSRPSRTPSPSTSAFVAFGTQITVKTPVTVQPGSVLSCFSS